MKNIEEVRESKYDLLGLAHNAMITPILELVSKSNNLQRSYNEGKISFLEYEMAQCKLYANCFPYLETAAHISYEMTRDIQDINCYDLINSDVTASDLIQVMDKTSRDKKASVRKLAVYSVIHSEDINLARIGDYHVVSSIIKGDAASFLSYCDANNIKLQSVNKRILESVANNDYDLGKTDDEVRCRVERRHEKFMNDNVYPNITATENLEERVVKQIKNIGKR